jgi:PD-(D/E)XK endonuclease
MGRNGKTNARSGRAENNGIPDIISPIRIIPDPDASGDILTLKASGSRRGDAAEAEFMARACGLDFRVAKPWGNIDPYDVLVGFRRGFWRVQVKCAYHSRRGYEAMATSTTSIYTKDDIDFYAAWVVQQNIWYIVPIEAGVGYRWLHFHPGTPGQRGESRLEKYREAWCLLKCSPRRRGLNDIPTRCRCRGELPTRCAVCPRRKH